MEQTDLTEIEKQEEELANEHDSNMSPPEDIVAYNELRSCADVYRMYDKKQLDISPDFQRGVVWAKKAQSLFIDSLSKQLPIPSMCISLDSRTNKRMVIDGLQRITSIIKFLSDDKWRLSSIKDIDERLSGKKVSDIKKNHLEIYERIENVTIPVTVIRCNFSKKKHQDYLFTIFHRLNTGGTKLNNQEIRNCIFSGTFNDFLKKDLNRNVKWNKILGKDIKKSYRFRYVEQILRFFALYNKEYTGRLTQFLNDYMSSKKDLAGAEHDAFKNIFDKTIDVIHDKILLGEKIENPTKAFVEGLLVGVAKNIDLVEEQSPEILQNKYRMLVEDEEFTTKLLEGGLDKKENVQSRLDRAISIFSE